MRAGGLLTLLLLWVGGLGAGFLFAARETAIPSPLAAGTTTSAPSTAPSPETATTGETPPSGRPSSTLKISLQDFKLVPNEVAGRVGTITFHLVNDGRYTHDFRVEGQGVNERAPRVGQGHERDFKVTLQPGTYRISCPISNHAKRGMTGTLVVK